MTERIARVPLIGVVVACVLLLASVVVMIVGGQVTGVSWDEPYRVGKLNNLFASGWFADDVKDGQPLDFNAFVYAPVSDLVSHAMGALAGVQEWSQAAVTPEAYAVRHLAIGLFAVIAVAAVAAVAALLLGSWRWGVIAAALLGAVPLWAGHGMFNSTDIPVAAGYTVATLGAVVLVRSVHDGLRLRSLAAGGAALAVGLALSIGTRPATWPALIITCAVAIGATPLLAARGSRARRLARMSVTVVAALAAAYAVLLLAYPAAFSQPARILRESVSQSARFGAEPGTEQVKPLLESVGYLPSWLYLQLPIVFGLLVLGGLVTAIALLVRVLVGRDREDDVRWRAAGLVAVGAQLLVLPAGAALMRSNVYDGVRQFLFVLPALAVVATIGLAAVVTLAARAGGAARVLPVVAWALVGIGVLLPMADQARLFPYGYAYVNELATSEPINGRLPTDYWRTSMRELIPLVPADGDTACNFDPLILGLVPIDCANQGQLSPFWDTRGSQSLGVTVPPGKYVYLEANRGRVDPGAGCSIVDKVTRTLHGQDVTMSYLAICEAPCVVQEAAQCAGKSLSGANLDGWNLRDSNFAGADLSGTSLILADLSGANLAGADLTGAILASTSFVGADLTGANLTGANLQDADLTGATLTGAIGLPAVGS